MPFPLLHKTILFSPGKKESGKMILRTGSSIGFQAQAWYLQPAAEPLRGDSSLTTAWAEHRGSRALPPPLPGTKLRVLTTRGACAPATARAVLPTAPGTSSTCTQTETTLPTATTTHRQEHHAGGWHVKCVFIF